MSLDPPSESATEPESQPLEEIDLLRRDRDRFVAFAFCNADVLIELDTSGEIVFAAGATQALLGRDADALVGQPIEGLVSGADRQTARQMLQGMRAGSRADNVVLRRGDTGFADGPISFNGLWLSEHGGRAYLSLRGAPEANRDELQRTEGGAFKRESFAAAAARAAIQAGKDGQACRLTLFDLGEIDVLRHRLDAKTGAQLAERVGAVLRDASLDGDLAGKFDGGHYGLVHATNVDPQALSAEIEACTKESDPAGEGVALRHSTIDMDTTRLSEKETARAVLYAINNYCEERGDDFTIRNLTDSLKNLAHDSLERVDRCASVIKRRDFALAYQPVCNLADRQPHHFEALIRFRQSSVEKDPYAFVTFAEEIGLICDLDLAVVTKVLEIVGTANSQGHKYAIAANISGRSLSTPLFVKRLLKLLSEANADPANVVFEITESAKIRSLGEANRIIQTLRRAGHVVCLDDFGAGEAAFEYLGALEVDIVKLDGAYIHKALISRRGKAVLKAMASMCAELAITAVAESIESSDHLDLVRDCGIHYGQGYYLGRPHTDLANFDAPRPAIFASRQTQRSRDRIGRGAVA